MRASRGLRRPRRPRRSPRSPLPGSTSPSKRPGSGCGTASFSRPTSGGRRGRARTRGSPCFSSTCRTARRRAARTVRLLLVFRPPRLRRRARRHPRHRQQRGHAHSVRVQRDRAAGRGRSHRVARAAALLQRQGRDVRHLVGRVQLDPHGDAPAPGAQGDHRRRRDRRPVPGRRPLHGRHDPRRLLGDEHGPRQRDARRAGLPDRRALLPRAFRPAALDADLQAATARRAVLGPHGAENPLRRDQDPDLRDRRLVRRLPRQRAPDARAHEGAGQGDRRRVEPHVPRRALSEAGLRVAPRSRALVRPVAQGPRHGDHGGAAPVRVRARVASAGAVPRGGAGILAVRGGLADRADPGADPVSAAGSLARGGGAGRRRGAAALRADDGNRGRRAGDVVRRRRAGPAAVGRVQPRLRNAAARRGPRDPRAPARAPPGFGRRAAGALVRAA